MIELRVGLHYKRPALYLIRIIARVVLRITLMILGKVGLRGSLSRATRIGHEVFLFFKKEALNRYGWVLLNLSDLRLWHRQPPLNDLLPVDISKKYVALYVLGVLRSRSEPLQRISVEQLQNEPTSLLRHGMRYLQRAALDILEKFRSICAEIWRHTYNHFVEENTQQVPINALCVALTLQHFRCKVGHRATERLGLL